MSKKGKRSIKKTVHLPKTTPVKRPSISVCLIVKDEERFLGNCLKSIKDIAGEIIIIDTGSRDNSVNIAKRYTDKIYFHPWKDSYSEARNHYFDYATGDWIFQIDADEELVKKDIPVLLKAVNETDADLILVQIVSHLDKGKSESVHSLERIFRNNGVIRYEGRIHERLTGFKGAAIYPVRLIHHGYDLNDKDQSDKKFENRIRLLKMDTEEYPDNPLSYHYLSCCYISRNLLHETLDSSLKAIELAERQDNKDSIFLWTRYNAALAYYKLKDFKKAEAMAISAIEKDGRHLDSYFILVPVYHDQSKWNEAIKYGNEYLHLTQKIKIKPEQFSSIVSNSLNEYWKVLIWMGIAYHETGNIKEAQRSFRTAASGATDTFSALKTIGAYYYSKALFQQARDHLKKALDINREDAAVNDMLNRIGTGQQDRLTISCCMIVKNEEQSLEKCLLSVRDHVDEIIIVDTGSTDNTVEIAKRYTEKVYFHEWEDSFTKARNQALQYAKGDWILQMDADEELMAGSGELIRAAVRDAGDSDIIYIRVYSGYAGGKKKAFHNYERLFRNNGKIHYEGNVHEQVVGGTKAFYSSAAIWHYGYDIDEIKAQKKFIRNTTLLKKEIEKNPENPMHHHNLSLSYFSRQMNEEAINEAVRAIELSDSQKNASNLYAWSHFIASMGNYRMGRLKEAREYAEKSLIKYPEHMDTRYVLAIIAADEERWDDVIKHGTIYLQLLESIENKKENVILGSAMNEGHWISILIGNAYHAKNSPEQMDSYYRSAYDLADEKWPIWWNIGTHHLEKSGDLELAGHYLYLSAKEAPEEHDVWYMLAKLNKKLGLIKEELQCLETLSRIGTKDSFIYNRLLSLYITEGMPDKAMGIIEIHTDKISVNAPVLYRIAVLFMEKGMTESAIKAYIMALEKDSGLFEAWASLGEIMLGMNKVEDSKTFLQKAISIKDNDIGTILNLCDVASREGDILLIVNCCDLLLKALQLPHDRTLNNLDDLRSILEEIRSRLTGNQHYQDQIIAISGRISQMKNY